MTKISELTSIVTAAATDIIAVVQGGVTKKATVQDYRDAGIIPTADQAAAVAAYEAALAAAEADQVLTASGPGEAAFAAPAGGGGPRVYAAGLFQAGTSAPVATEFANTIGGAATWTRINTGRYRLQFADIVLDGNKTLIMLVLYVGGAPFFVTWSAAVSIGTITVNVYDNTGAYVDGLLLAHMKVEAY